MNKEINIIDFEATGLGQLSYPIQVAVILDDGTTYDAYIHPTDDWLENWEWDMEAEKIHNIPFKLLADVGKPVEVVAQELNEFIGKHKVYCDGGRYDIHWKNALFDAANIKPTFVLNDTYELAPNQWLGEYKEGIGCDMGLKEHDALNDVKIIQECIRRIINTRNQP